MKSVPKPILKKYHNKDFNIAYANGYEDALKKMKELKTNYTEGMEMGKILCKKSAIKEVLEILERDLEYHNKRAIEHQEIYLKKKKENKNKLFYADLQKEIRHREAIKYIKELKKELKGVCSTISEPSNKSHSP